MTPLERIEDKARHWNAEGVPLGGGSAAWTGGYLPSEPHYFIQRNRLYVFPFWNQAMVDGLRVWQDYSPPNPSADTWVPFDGFLPDHHEVIALGAAIRGKKREEVSDHWSDLYTVAYNKLIIETENRQIQTRRHGASRSGLY